MRNGITLPILKIKRDIVWIKNAIHSLNNFVDQINTNTYNDYNISDICFNDASIYRKSSDMRVTYENIFQRQHTTMKKPLITLCKNTSKIYYLNILRIITIMYHNYIESGLYQLAYGRCENWIFQVELLNKTMGKCKYHDYFTRDVIA